MCGVAVSVSVKRNQHLAKETYNTAKETYATGIPVVFHALTEASLPEEIQIELRALLQTLCGGSLSECIELFEAFL